MYARYLICNQAFVIMFGDVIIDLDGQRFFTTRDSLQHRLNEHGLELKPNLDIDTRKKVAS